MRPLPTGVTLVCRHGQQVLELFDAVCELYDAVFSQPPFDWPEGRSEEHRRSLERLRADPTFGMATADVGGELVGFAYGLTLKPDTKWWQGADQPLPDDLTVERAGRTFAVIDLGVRADRRRRGIGRALLSTLLNGRQEERATLAVQPHATGAQAPSARLGWPTAGRLSGAPTAAASILDLSVLRSPTIA